MNKRATPFLFLISLSIFFTPFAFSIQMEGEKISKPAVTETEKKYLNGKLVSISKTKLETTVGDFELSSVSQIIDRRESTSAKQANIQVTIKNNIVTKVIIFE